MIENFNGPGIYALYNREQHKIYIGKSNCINNRFNAHKRSFTSKHNKNTDNPMYNCDLNDFDFFILQKMDMETYESFGGPLELLYMFQAFHQGIELYNREKFKPGTKDFYFKLACAFSWKLHAYDNMHDAFVRATGKTPAQNRHALDLRLRKTS